MRVFRRHKDGCVLYSGHYSVQKDTRRGKYIRPQAQTFSSLKEAVAILVIIIIGTIFTPLSHDYRCTVQKKNCCFWKNANGMIYVTPSPSNCIVGRKKMNVTTPPPKKGKTFSSLSAAVSLQLHVFFSRQKQAPPIPPKPKSRTEDNTAKLAKVAISPPKEGSGDKHHHHHQHQNKDKPGPTMRKKSMKKKKMTDEEILAALSE